MQNMEVGNESKFHESVVDNPAECSISADDSSVLGTAIKLGPAACSTPQHHNVNFNLKELMSRKRLPDSLDIKLNKAKVARLSEVSVDEKICSDPFEPNGQYNLTTYDVGGTENDKNTACFAKTVASSSANGDQNQIAISFFASNNNNIFSDDETLLNSLSDDDQDEDDETYLYLLDSPEPSENSVESSSDSTTCNTSCCDTLQETTVSEDSTLIQSNGITPRGQTLQGFLKQHLNNQHIPYPQWLENAKRRCTATELIELMNSVYEPHSDVYPQDLSTYNYRDVMKACGRFPDDVHSGCKVDDFYHIVPDVHNKRFSTLHQLTR